MNSKLLKTVIGLLLCGMLFWAFHFPHRQIPPLGKLLNPFSGFWQNNRSLDRIGEQIFVKGLQEPVTVVWDERRVPHIFASNDHDLYFAQGYLTARDRLWQMEFQAMAAAGRIAEIVGASALDYDRYQRRIGLLWAAERTVEAVNADSLMRSVVFAYTAGVNAYIRSLNLKKLPVEYKILDYQPEPWTPLKSALILKSMQQTLTTSSSDLALTRARLVFGEAMTDSLFPYFPYFPEPIIPAGTRWKPSVAPRQKPNPDFALPAEEVDATIDGERIAGSNNWAVSGKKTRDGFPILCNDPHLGLRLPSVWYEVQLHAPGLNAYGVSLPGTPGIIIGFNEHVAWGLTNAGSDVFDWYVEQFRDSSYQEYLFEGQYLPASRRVEEIRIRGGKTVYDTVIYTRHGPIVNRVGEKRLSRFIPFNAALRWTAHDPSREFHTFYWLNRAQNADEIEKALRFFSCPAQNVVFADYKNTIGIRHTGKFPLRWRGQGRYLLDGREVEHEWQGWVPFDDLPHITNPRRGFVSSANQIPVDANYPYYLGWRYASFGRAKRINQLLEQNNQITPEFMTTMQMDSYYIPAKMALPKLLASLNVNELPDSLLAIYRELKNWSYEYRTDQIAPTVFDAWWAALSKAIWQDEMEKSGKNALFPGLDVTLDLILHHPESRFVDDTRTPEKETLAQVAQKTFGEACKQLWERYGEFGANWRWAKTKGTNINHLARIPGFGRTGLATDGRAGAINATSRTFGPSWRMVVQLSQPVRAWGIYPGGQSGNPGSPFYDSMVDDWVLGKTYELLFLKSLDENRAKNLTKTTLRRVK